MVAVRKDLCHGTDAFQLREGFHGAFLCRQFHGLAIGSLALPPDGRQLAGLEVGMPFQNPHRIATRNRSVLCHLAFNAPLLTRRQRADRVKKQETTFFKFFAPEAREILNDLLEKYATDGELQFTLPDVLKVRPISDHGNVNEIIGKFGGADQLRNAVNQLQSLLYSA